MKRTGGLAGIAALVLVGACARAGEGGDGNAFEDAVASVAHDAGPTTSPSSPLGVSFPGDSEADDSGSALDDGGLDGTIAPPENDDAAPADSSSPSSGDGDAATSSDATSSSPNPPDRRDATVNDANPPDVSAPVAPPTCGETCTSGCCDSTGTCVESSNETCGSSGGTCQDCVSTGQTCKSGVCVGSPPVQPPPDAQAPPPDAQPPVEPPPAQVPDAGGATCNASACTNLCVPYFVQCCKADDTCGCSLLFPPGPCN